MRLRAPSMNVFHFSRIIIIQSLPAEQLHSGSRLREDLCVLNDAYDFGLEIELFEVSTKNFLIAKLEELIKEVSSKGYPIIHIEAHGSEDKEGIILSSGEFVSWSDLKTPSIMATRNNLFIVLAACYGAHIVEILDLTDRAPCCALIGPIKKVDSNAILRDFTDFYKEMLVTGDGGRAVQVLNSNAKEEDTLYYITRQRFFLKKFSINI